MKKILLPLEETERSLKALHHAKKQFTPDEAEFLLMMVDERLGYTAKSEAEANSIREIEDKLRVIATTLEGYRVSIAAAVGKAGLRITRTARETGCDMIIMSKSSKEDMLNSVGTTAEYVINNAPCDVLIVSDSINSRNEYRGLVYKTAKGVVNLRGQLGDKQSECLLPSINQDCIYHIEVTVGKIRFFHTAYNPDTRNWDLPPLPGQDVTLDIAAGETKNILVKADSNDGKADRIRIVNRDMKKEAVFSFRILAADSAEAELKKEDQDKKMHEAMANRATIEMSKIRIPDDFEMPEVPTFVPDAKAEEMAKAEEAPKEAATEAPAATPAPAAETAAPPAEPAAPAPAEAAKVEEAPKAETPAAEVPKAETPAAEVPKVEPAAPTEAPKAEPAPVAGPTIMPGVGEIKSQAPAPEPTPAPAATPAPAPVEAPKPVEAAKPAEAPKPVEAPKPAETPAPAAAPAPAPKEAKPKRQSRAARKKAEKEAAKAASKEPAKEAAPAKQEDSGAVFSVEIHE